MKTENTIWKFFASVKLALFTLGCLAVGSIIGTIIPQKESIQFYISKYGPKTAQFFQLFSIQDMYASWWFLALLLLLSINLIVCSIDRFPLAWRLIKKDNLSIPGERIRNMGLSKNFQYARPLANTAEEIQSKLAEKGWKVSIKKGNDSMLLFSQKTPISRTGVYFVHLSILIIFAGAIYGNVTGFKGSIMLPELQSSNVVYPTEEGAPIDLGFEIRCDRFDIEFYGNSMPKEYRSRLVVLENGNEVLSKDIEVNGPLQYKGITFYQASYQGFRDFIFRFSQEQDKPTVVTGEYQEEVVLDDKGLSFGIINLESVGDRVTRLKIWFNDGYGEPSVFWMNAGETVKVNRPDTHYTFSAKQRYATGLQVAKDPGVWIVYIGCGVMILGLYMAFFMSHKRIWLLLHGSEESTTVELRGTVNKNKAGFEKQFSDLSEFLNGQST